MESSRKKRVHIATPKIAEMKKQTDNANNLIPETRKRKRRENSCSKTKSMPKQENAEVPSLMSAITIIGDSVLKRKKRTILRRRSLNTEITEPMRRLANAAERVFLPPKETDDMPKVRLSIPPSKDKNELIIRPKEENDPSDLLNNETETKRRRGSLSKHQVSTLSSPSTRRIPDKPVSARLKKGSDRKTSLSRKVHRGVDRSGESHQTPLDKNELKQLDPRPQPCPPELPPPPQPWPTMSPAWLQSEPYNQPFMNVGSSSTNGADYKGKKVVVDDENDKGKKPSSENILDFLLRTPKGGIKIHSGSNENAKTDKDSIPPRDRDFFRDFINEVSGAKTNPIHIVQDGGNNSNPTKTGMPQTSQKKNVKSKTHVSPSTYLRQAARKSGGGPRPSTGGGAASSVQSSPPTQAMQPPTPRDAQPLLPWGGQSRLTRDFMSTRVQETPEPPPRQGGRRRSDVPDSHDVSIQRCAEGIFGKEAFANGVPPLAGPLTAMMIISMNPGCREAMGALAFFENRPPQSSFRTTTTTTHSHQFLPPPAPPRPPPPFAGQGELELASTSEPNLLCHNSWAPSNGNLLVQPDTYETTQPPPAHVTPPNHHQAPPQLVTNPFLFNNNLFQQQSNLFMPTPVLPPQLPPQMTAFGVPNFPGQYLQGYAGSSGDSNWVTGNWGYQGPPPPGF